MNTQEHHRIKYTEHNRWCPNSKKSHDYHRQKRWGGLAPRQQWHPDNWNLLQTFPLSQTNYQFHHFQIALRNDWGPYQKVLHSSQDLDPLHPCQNHHIDYHLHIMQGILQQDSTTACWKWYISNVIWWNYQSFN